MFSIIVIGDLEETIASVCPIEIIKMEVKLKQLLRKEKTASGKERF
jgi:hypothetical protein